MTETKFYKLAKEAVASYYNTYCVDSPEKKVTVDNVFVVWMCKTLQNNKAILSMNTPDRCLYEVTYNGDENELYIDKYEKQANMCLHPHDLE